MIGGVDDRCVSGDIVPTGNLDFAKKNTQHQANEGNQYRFEDLLHQPAPARMAGPDSTPMPTMLTLPLSRRLTR